MNIRQSSIVKGFNAKLTSLWDRSELVKILFPFGLVIWITFASYSLIVIVAMLYTYGNCSLGEAYLKFILFVFIPLVVGAGIFYLNKKYFVEHVDYVQCSFDGMLFVAGFLILIDHIYPKAVDSLNILYGNETIWGATLNILLFRPLLGYYVIRDNNHKKAKEITQDRLSRDASIHDKMFLP